MSAPKAERRVYNLPDFLVRRIEAFREAKRLPSEAEAARVLLTMAFQNQDTVETIQSQMASAFNRLGSIRLAAAEVLAMHPRVKQIEFAQSAVSYTMADDTVGYFTIVTKGIAP